MDSQLILPIFITLIFSFFFSGIEIAFLSANQLQIELQSKRGVRWGKIMLQHIKKPSWFIGTTLVGNTLALTLFGMLITQLIEPIFSTLAPSFFHNELYAMLVQTLISTLIILFLAEFLPKSLFLINPNFMLVILAVPFQIMFYLLAPITFAIVYLSKFIIIRILKIEYSEEKPVFELTDLTHYLENTLTVRHEDEEVELDKKFFHNATQLKTIKLRECIVPRTEIVAVSYDDTLETLSNAFINSGHSKIMVYSKSIDNIIGYCHSSALFKKPKTIQDILTPTIMVPETMMAQDLMIQFIRERKSLAVVVDEFGGTSGIVSMEDVIEEIFGEIEDEHDEGALVRQKIDDRTYILSARHEIDYLNDTYDWNLPVGDYETLGGMILSVMEDFPKEGALITIPPYTFIVQTTENNRIDTLKMVIK